MLTKIVFGILMVLIGIVLIVFDKVIIRGTGILKTKKKQIPKLEFFLLRIFAWFIGIFWLMRGIMLLYLTLK